MSNVLYNPSGKAQEYAYFGVNAYTGCLHGCQYCYCKKGVLKSVWHEHPILKKGFKDIDHAINVFESEIKNALDTDKSDLLIKYGIFFSFMTDPMIIGKYNTIEFTYRATVVCQKYNIPVKILTKTFEWMNESYYDLFKDLNRSLIAFGATITGMDDLEPNATSNKQRIRSIKELSLYFRTFYSFEPIISLDITYEYIRQALNTDIDHRPYVIKIGLLSDHKYNKDSLLGFYNIVAHLCYMCNTPVYFKDDLLSQIDVNRIVQGYLVDRTYNIFKNEQVS